MKTDRRFAKKFGKSTLLILAAFLVMVISNTATGAKPPSAQKIMSAPLAMGFANCTVLWLDPDYIAADRDLTVTIRGRYAAQVYEPPQTDIATYDIPTSFESSVDDSAYCMVEWVGNTDDVRASFCSAVAGDYPSAGCVELY